MNGTSVSKRKVHIDIFRFIAMFLVMYCHTGDRAVNHYHIPGSKISLLLCIAARVFAIASPSMYFFISGGLLLSKEESIKDVLKKRVLRYVIVMIVFKAFQLVYLLMTNPEYAANPAYKTNPVRTVFNILYSQDVVTQYWFIHAYLAFLLLLPILRILAQNMKDRHFMYLLMLFFILNVGLVIIEYFLKLDRIDLSISIFEEILFYPLVGYFIISRLGDRVNNKKFLTYLNISGFMLYIFDVYYGYRNYAEGNGPHLITGLVPLWAIIIYCDIKYLCDKTDLGSRKFSGFISFCAAASLVTYLLDPQLHRITEIVYDKTYLKITWFPAAVLWCFSALAIGIVIGWILRQIPYVGKLFGAK